MKTILFILLLTTTPAFADEWITADTWREGTYLGLLAIDWHQTRVCLASIGCYEKNPAVGKHPSSQKLNVEVATTALTHIVLAAVLPEKFRAPFQYISIGVEGEVTWHNYRVRVTLGF